MSESAGSRFFKYDFYAPSYYAIYIALENWLAKVAFRNDLSRVFLASDGYAFRRRHEITNLSENFAELSFKSLDIPFANYWPLADGWLPDDRAASNHAGLLYRGLSNTNRMVRAMMVKNSVPITLYYDREDDARLAYENLLWVSYREQYIYTSLSWENEKLEVPVNIKLQNLQFNPDFTEKDWLKEQRIVTIKAQVDVRSAIMAPIQQPDYTGGDVILDDNQSFHLTEESILQFYNEKNLEKEITVTSLFNENPSLSLNQVTLLGASSTSARLYWDVTVVDSTLETITIQVSGRSPETIINPDLQFEHVIRELQGNSLYIVTLTFRLANGVSKTASLQFTTPILAENLDEVVASKSTVVGTSW